MAVDLFLFGDSEFSRPSRIDRATHPARRSHQRGLWLQAAVAGLSVGRDIPRKIEILEDDGVVMLQDQVSLRFADKACRPVSGCSMED